MRYTVIEGLDDDVSFNLGSDVNIICGVMERGKTIDYLVYKAELTGEEVLKLMADARNPHILDDDIVKDNRYILTAYDD